MAEAPKGAMARYPELAGKAVLVTGGARGLGGEVVRAFHG